MEKSGIDMLEEILKRLEKLEQKVNILDQNIKTIINTTRIADMVTKAADTPLNGWARAIPDVKEKIAEKRRELEKGFANFKFESTMAPMTPMTSMAPMMTKPNMPNMTSNNIIVKGKMVANTDGKPISLANVSVTIFDSNDKLVKKTKTNRAGHWMSQLPPGKYVALFEGELNGKKLVSQNRNFEVPDHLPPGQTEIEVT
jgi:hypothetical protein